MRNARRLLPCWRGPCSNRPSRDSFYTTIQSLRIHSSKLSSRVSMAYYRCHWASQKAHARCLASGVASGYFDSMADQPPPASLPRPRDRISTARGCLDKGLESDLGQVREATRRIGGHAKKSRDESRLSRLDSLRHTGLREQYWGSRRGCYFPGGRDFRACG